MVYNGVAIVFRIENNFIDWRYFSLENGRFDCGFKVIDSVRMLVTAARREQVATQANTLRNKGAKISNGYVRKDGLLIVRA